MKSVRKHTFKSMLKLEKLKVAQTGKINVHGPGREGKAHYYEIVSWSEDR